MITFKNYLEEGERGLWDNIHAKQKRIKNGSGERMRKPGSKGAPTPEALKASQTNEELDEAIKINSKVTIHAPGKSYHGKTGHIGEIRYGLYKGAPKTYTVDHEDGSIQLDKKNIKLHKEEVVAEGLPQTLRKVVPGYAKREIDKKMDDQKFGRTDVDKDANYYRYKKIQDKIKNKGVAEEVEDQFDLIEEVVEELAFINNVDPEILWEQLESLTDDELLEYAVDAKGHKSSTGGLTQKGRDAYNAGGAHLKAPVTTPPSKLKAGSKAANRRKSFCARMGGMEGSMKKPNGEPSRKALALRKWNC